MAKIRKCSSAAHSGGLGNNTEPSIKDLARQQTVAESCSNAADIVDSFLSSTKLPSFDGTSPAGRGRLPIDSCYLTAIVTFDLAVCSRAVPEVSQELLQVVQSKLNSAGMKPCPQVCVSLESFIEDMIKLLDVVTSEQSVDLVQRDSLASLLALSAWPLSADDYQTAVSGLVCIEEAVSRTRDGLLQHSLHPTANCLCSSTPSELFDHFADVFHTALQRGALCRGGFLPVLQRFVVILSQFVLVYFSSSAGVGLVNHTQRV